MGKKTIVCHECKASWDYWPPLGRRDACPKCGVDARVCLNCEFYDPSYYHECREDQAEWVREKNTGNFCGYFEPLATRTQDDCEKADPKAKLDALFGGASSPKPQTSSLADELASFMKKKKS